MHNQTANAPAEQQLGPGRPATPAEIKRFSALTPPLAMLDTAALERVAAVARIHSVPAGTRIIRYGEPGRSMYVLVEGRTEAVSQDRDAPRVLETHTPGAWFGEIAAVVRVPRQADVIAVQAVTLLELPHDALDELLNNAAVRAVVIELLQQRWKRIRADVDIA